MKTDVESALSSAVIGILLLMGLLIVVLAVVIGGVSSLTLLGGVGGALLASGIAAAARQYILPRRAKYDIIERHDAIYGEFRRALNSLDDDQPHSILTIHSFPPEERVMAEHDAFVTDWLRRNPATRFTRVVISQKSPRWDRRFKELQNYLQLSNYQQYDFQGPPTLEMFLVDEDVVIVSFSKHEVNEPTISSAIRLRDRRLCRLLAAYHRAHLQLDSHRHRVTLENE